MANKRRQPDVRNRRVAIVGAGVIGSALGLMVARMDGIGSAAVIDPDIVEERNGQQQFLPSDVGQAKAKVLARRMRQINPRMKVEAWQAAVEDVPLGLLRTANVLVACLDNRAARLYVNQAARSLGVCWIDAGVEPSAMLARVNVYRPLADQPCMQCAWSDADYALLGAVYPCQRESPRNTPTNAPAALGTLAASLQAIELQKVLAGRWDEALVGKQATLCALTHRLHITRFACNPACRCQHDAWSISPVKLRENCTVGELLEATEGDALRVEGGSFVRTLACQGCSRRRPMLRLHSRLGRRQPICRHCGGKLVPVGFDQLTQLSAATLGKRGLCASLRGVGFLDSDIVTIEAAGKLRRYQLQLRPARRHV